MTRGVLSRLQCAAFVLLVLCALSSEAQPPVRHVLLLESLDRGNLILDSFIGDFRVDLDRRAGRRVNVVQVVVGPTGFVGAPEQAVVDYIRSIFAGRPAPDLIVTVAGPAAVFAQKYRQQLFPERPLLFASVDHRYLGGAPLAGNETSVEVLHDHPLMIDDILQLLPETRQVFMVMGSGQISRFWHRQLEDDFKQFHDRLTFVWSDEMSLPEVERRCATLPSHSAIFYFNFGTDASGSAYADERVIADLHASANAPLFELHTVTLGHGMVGGRLIDIELLAHKTADVAVRILNGAPPASLRLPPQLPGQPIFDWRELKRWSIPESRLPAGSVVRYRNPSPWLEYRLAILGGAATLLIQSLLIIGLIYERRARQRAEMESRKNLTLAADVSRRQTIAALGSSIAHELGQPLNSMTLNARALHMMVDADDATSEKVREVLSDIRAQGERATQILNRHRTMLRSRQVEKRPIGIHTLVNESLALVARDMAQREIETTVDLPSSPCVISGDPVLLQQVFVNLLMNAMDAAAEAPPARRRVTIKSEVRPSSVEVSVRDTGTGVAANVIDTLFEPFVTTKAHGLGIGLTIASTIIEAHGGEIDADNNPEGGATFTVMLPLSA